MFVTPTPTAAPMTPTPAPMMPVLAPVMMPPVVISTPAPMPMPVPAPMPVPMPTPAPVRRPAASTTQGPHTGAVLIALPLADLNKRGGGVWNGRVRWNKSRLDTFQGEQVVRVFYKQGSGTSLHPFKDASGVSFSIGHPAVAGQRAAVVAFDIYFDPANWNWARGGKIGGIHIGPGKSSGLRHSPNGSSHRLMWQRDGGAISYIYPPSGLVQQDPRMRTTGGGVGYFGNVFKPGTLKVGAWNRVEIGVKLNSFDAAGNPRPDGKSQLTINGVSGVLDNVKWARSPDIKINSFSYGTFFGGPDPAKVDSVSYVKNFVVHAWKD